MVEYIAVRGLLEDLPAELRAQAESVRGDACKSQLRDGGNLKIVEVVRDVERIV